MHYSNFHWANEEKLSKVTTQLLLSWFKFSVNRILCNSFFILSFVTRLATFSSWHKNCIKVNSHKLKEQFLFFVFIIESNKNFNEVKRWRRKAKVASKLEWFHHIVVFGIVIMVFGPPQRKISFSTLYE